jgi:uncharacterized protein YecE (DUF72 family)
MAKQIDLFGGLSGGPPSIGASEPPAPKAPRGRRKDLFDPTALPAPPKIGPPRLRFGTSSWTYPGWGGLVYRDVAAYGARFSQNCLAEYARDPRFRTASADNLYYVAPSQRLPMLSRFREQTSGLPEPFDLCPKVWHGVTVNRYTALQRDKWRLSTEINRHFLDPDVFLDEVLLPLREGLGPCLGPLILEIQENDLHPAAFAQALDRFLSAAQARAGAPFAMAVELRTLAHFTGRYLDVLAAHAVGHALNSWTRMPPIGWQHQRVRARQGAPRPGQVVLIRALLKPGALVVGSGGPELIPGSTYDEAVEAYAPYDHIERRLPEVRADILRVLHETPEPTPAYVLINNRLEGHAPGTVAELQSAYLQHAPSAGDLDGPGGQDGRMGPSQAAQSVLRGGHE